MPKTTKRWDHRQNIGAVFSSRTNADKAIQAFRDLGVSDRDIEEVVSVNDTVRNGKILVTVHNVKNSASIIDIFDRNKSEFNPDGSRNIRQDVAGLTVGAAAGAATGAVSGILVAGPAGATVGGTVGAIIGGGVGAAAGEVVEHRK